MNIGNPKQVPVGTPLKYLQYMYSDKSEMITVLSWQV